MNDRARPNGCSTVSCGPLTPVHLASTTPTAGSPASALCGATCSRSAPALMFLDVGCAACARRALAKGITVAEDRSGGVSLQRFARAS